MSAEDIQYSRFFRFYFQCIITLICIFAAEGSTLFFTSPFPVRELYAAKKSILGCLYIRKDDQFMTFFDVTEMLKNIMTYSRLRFDFPNTLVETREQHCGP
jgi:hypothetical protein